MIVPVKNIVEQVDLTSEDVLLPMMECIVNSIISLQQSELPKEDKKIQVKIERGEHPHSLNLENVKTISTITVTDNGIGFNKNNYKSFETPFSQINKDFGCKGIGRFTVLAAFQEYKVKSKYKEDNKWFLREFKFTKENEIEPLVLKETDEHSYRTTVKLGDCVHPLIKERSALSLEQISEMIMRNCLIYYLNETLPIIEIFDAEDNTGEVINELYERVSKEAERYFEIGDHQFKLYITKTPKEGNRKNNYLYLCANSRTVGNGRNLKNVNSIFTYPVTIKNNPYFFDIYLVSDFLNTKVYKARNGFNIPKERENVLHSSLSSITMQDIDEKVSEIIESEYQDFVKESKAKTIKRVTNYIAEKAPRYNSFLRKPNVLNSIPPNLTDDKLEEHLYKISFNARKSVEGNIEKFIKNKEVSDEAINQIIDDIKEKTSYDVDSLADYMTRRKAIIELFDKFLDADESGKYKLEEDVHNLIFPLGLTNNDLDYENHNLWLLDERFINYRFIASDKSITSFSQVKSRKEADILMVDHPQMFNNPISFGNKSSGEVNSLVIFEFKRPGDVAHQKNKTDYRWEFSDLIEPYFDSFLYDAIKKNYKGNQVIVRPTTPKFGFIILDMIPDQLAVFNERKGWKKTPFGTFFKIEAETNQHIEVMTFRNLLDFSKERHNPFFDKLFT